jgi:GNAT superfamily N-acetyltransferase
MKVNGQLIHIRPSFETDALDIINTWVDPYRYSGWNEQIPEEIYKKRQQLTILDLIQHGTRVCVACPAEDPGYILGYLAWGYWLGDKIVDWIHVKKFWRRKGIARALMDYAGISTDEPILMSHPSYIVKKFKKYQYIYIPVDLELRWRKEPYGGK